MSERKSYSYAKQDGRPDIAMPAEGEIPAIERLTNPAYQSMPQPQDQSSQDIVFNSVPDTVEQYDQEEVQEFSEQDPVQEYKQPQEQIEERESKQVSSKSSSENFKELRLARERAEKKAEQQEALIAHLLSLQNQQSKQPSQPKQQEQDIDELLSSVSDDAFMEGKDYKRFAKATKRQVDDTARQLAEYKQQLADMAAEAKVRAKCPDLDSVVTEENIYLLRERHPEVAAALNAAPDGWDKYNSVYTMIKSLGIHKTRSYDRDKAQAVSNSQKPKPAASLSPQQGESPLTGINAFVQDRKLTKDGASSVWKEMQDAMKKG